MTWRPKLTTLAALALIGCTAPDTELEHAACVSAACMAWWRKPPPLEPTPRPGVEELLRNMREHSEEWEEFVDPVYSELAWRNDQRGIVLYVDRVVFQGLRVALMDAERRILEGLRLEAELRRLEETLRMATTPKTAQVEPKP